MAIKKELVDELLKDMEPKELFASEGLMAELKKALAERMPDAISWFEALAVHYDTYILSTAPWGNPSAWIDKVVWVQRYLGQPAYKPLILSHHKNLNDGHYLIDDRTKNGVDRFRGEHIHFGTERFPDWQSVGCYLLPNMALPVDSKGLREQ